MLEKLKSLVVDIGDSQQIREVVLRGLESKVQPVDIANALSEALCDVGMKYERGEYFLAELIMVGNLATEVVDLLKPHLDDAKLEASGKVVIGTVKGDLHDIGKNIVIMMLKASGFGVVDLGVDVPIERFIEAARKENPNILGMSALLSSTAPEMKKVIYALEKAKLRGTLKVIVGGRPVTSEFAEEIGADGYAEDAVEATRLVKALVKTGCKE
jgi:5-methyltetrahydrofolate--homocysteine methyltransferase